MTSELIRQTIPNLQKNSYGMIIFNGNRQDSIYRIKVLLEHSLNNNNNQKIITISAIKRIV
jgi:hypothetical protein